MDECKFGKMWVIDTSPKRETDQSSISVYLGQELDKSSVYVHFCEPGELSGRQGEGSGQELWGGRGLNHSVHGRQTKQACGHSSESRAEGAELHSLGFAVWRGQLVRKATRSHT